MNESTSQSSSTTLRPRTRRPLREDEDGQTSVIPKPSKFLDGPSPSTSSSRAPSPLPRTRPSQPTRYDRDGRPVRSNNDTPGFSSILASQSSPAAVATGLWESSWASIQGLALSLLGNESPRTSTPNRSPSRRRPSSRAPYGTRNTSAPPAQWGPSGNAEKQIAAGSKEDRRAQVQAKRREALLTANTNAALDATGRYKRRDSNEIEPSSADDEAREALVYLHRVKPEDTLAGVAIRYNCPSAVFRKANRLWANDTLQIRKIVVLPVDACGVRGRRVPGPFGEPSVGPSAEEAAMDEMTPTQTTMNIHGKSPSEASAQLAAETPLSSIPTSPSISVTFSTSDEPAWTHDSWVMIDGFPDAVEIARLSRKALGYFPRSRRKSQSISDLETPSASFDLPRPSYQSRASSPRRHLSVQGSQSRSSSASQFAKRLQGPGGVGTMRSNVRSPGPAQDGLNKMFAAHLPKLAPKTSSESIHSTSSHGNTSGIENLGGALEGWVRKVANKASNSMQPSGPGGNLREGDLIELSEDAFGLNAGVEDGDSKVGTEGRKNTVTGWTAEQQEQMLHEHFPPRGRVFADNSTRSNPR